MTCPNCQRTSPADAQFCIYCATRLVPEAPVVETTPVTGPTMRFDQTQGPAYSLPTPAPAPQPALNSGRHHHRRQPNKEAGTAVFLIGLGMLILTGNWWPGILALIGVTMFVNEAARGRQREAMQGLLFFVGLTILFSTHFFWPGLLIWLGIMALMNKGHWRGC